MKNKMTAVDWLAENIDNLIPYINDKIANKYNELLKQAKAMEQQQIVEAFHEGMQTNFDSNYGIALKYYESNYGK